MYVIECQRQKGLYNYGVERDMMRVLLTLIATFASVGVRTTTEYTSSIVHAVHVYCSTIHIVYTTLATNTELLTLGAVIYNPALLYNSTVLYNLLQI